MQIQSLMGGKKDAILNKEIKEHHVAYYKLIDG